MNPGKLVVFGWRYRNNEIHATPARYGITLGNVQTSKDAIVEVLEMSRGEWFIDELIFDACTVDVLWNNGQIGTIPIDNLIEVRDV